MSAITSLFLFVLLALTASCHDDKRLGTGNTGASTTPSDRAQQIGTTRTLPTVSQPPAVFEPPGQEPR